MPLPRLTDMCLNSRHAGWLLAASVAALATPAWAQNNASTVSQAQDAFGQRIGNEEIGLYSESLVRGFSLENAGNYRIDGHYYVRSAKLPDVVLSGVSIEVGSNALSGSFPAPSGIVATKLSRAGAEQAGLTVETGVRSQFQPFVETKGWLANADHTLSMTGGVLVSPAITFADGTKGEEYAAGIVPRASLGNIEVTGVAAWSQRTFNGNYSFKNTGSELPPKLKGNHLFAPKWQDYKNTTVNLGTMAKWKQDRWEGLVSAFWSANELPISDFTMLSFVGPQTVNAVASTARDQFTRSFSSEGSLARSFAALGLEHKLTANVRYRRTTTRSTPGVSLNLGEMDLNVRDYATMEPYWNAPEWEYTGVHSAGLITQKSAGLSYELNARNWFKIQSGLQRVQYSKRVHTQGLAAHQTDNDYWIYNAALVVPVWQNWIAFGSYTRGLEEKGTAPNNAVNRNEVLPAVIAEQVELGVRGKIAGRVTVAAALFEISKPTTGFDHDGYFGLQGDVRHRGAEFSLSGKVTRDLTLATGAVYLDPKNSGLAVEDGTVSRWPMGQSKFTGQINAEHAIPPIKGLSIDGQVSYNSPRPADLLDTHRTEGSLLFDIGSRYRFSMYGNPTVLRVRLQNVLNNRVWNSASSGTISRLRARVATFSLQTTI